MKRCLEMLEPSDGRLFWFREEGALDDWLVSTFTKILLAS